MDDTSLNIKLKTSRYRSNNLVIWGSILILLLILASAVVLFLSLPDANAFNDRVERIFLENDAITTTEQVKLLEIMAQSGTAFAGVLEGYRLIIF